MKKRLISLIAAGAVALSLTGFFIPAVNTNAATNTIASTQNEEAFAISFSKAYYSVNQELKASYHGKALVGDSIYLLSKDNEKGVGKTSYHYTVKDLTSNEDVSLNYSEGSPSLTWTPNKAGLYEVKVYAHDEAGHSAENTIRYSIDNRFTPDEVPDPNTRANQGGKLKVGFKRADYYNPTLNFFYTGNARENDNIYFVADATGGVGKLTYKYRISVYHGGPNDYIESTSNYPVYNWRPTGGGYLVGVTVTDEAGNTASASHFYSISYQN